MNSREFFHDTFGSMAIIYDGRGNVYSSGEKLAEKLGCSKEYIFEVVPYEFIVSLESVKRYCIEKFSSDSIILSEPGIHILLASSENPLARDLSIWLFSEIFPKIRGNPYHAVYY